MGLVVEYLKLYALSSWFFFYCIECQKAEDPG